MGEQGFHAPPNSTNDWAESSLIVCALSSFKITKFIVLDERNNDCPRLSPELSAG